MEWLNTIITLTCSLIAAVGGGSILYYKSNRDMKNMEVRLKGAEVDRQQVEIENNHSAAWKDLYEESRQENRELSSKIDELYKETHNLNKKLPELEQQVRKLTPLTCERISCKRRLRCDNVIKENFSKEVK